MQNNSDIAPEQLAQLIRHQQDEKKKAQQQAEQQQQQRQAETPFMNLRAPDAEWSFPFYMTEKPKRDPELIEGLLLEGGIQQLLAPSKAMKTTDVIQKAICLALGIDYLGHRTFRARKVLIVNTELRKSQYEAIFFDVCEALFPGFPESFPEELKDNLAIIHRKGSNLDTINKLCNEVYKHRAEGYEVLFIDPMYKIFQGDENKAGDWNICLNNLEKLGQLMSLTIFYSHHFRKGNASEGATLDLGAGSGVKERQADDTETRRELYIPQQIRTAKGWDESVRAYEVEHISRDYYQKPMRVYYKYPLFYPDTDGALRGLPEIDSYEAKKLKARDQASELDNNPYMNLREALGKGKGAKATKATATTAPREAKETPKQKEARENKAIASAMQDVFESLGADTLGVNDIARELESLAKARPEMPSIGFESYKKRVVTVCALYPGRFYRDESKKIHLQEKS